ncbi:MAG TPA: DNA polymerase III subunit beta [Actinomycetota bacterium]|nr:DNA polymerase III subunit beta [Actinomycetota bacterium]
MKFKCDRDALSDALQVIGRTVSARPGIPALSGVLMNATGSELVLAATDLEVSAQLRVPVQVQTEGVALVPARLVADMVKSFEQAPVDFDAEDGQARVVCANYEGTIRCLPAEDFPVLQEPGGIRVSVNAGEFGAAVGQVARAASRDEARPLLTGVLLEVSREGVTMVATDSYRLALRELTATAEGEAKALVPERALSEAGRGAAADEKGDIELFLEPGSVAFRVGSQTLTSRLIEGEFPAYRALLPEDYESRLTASRQQLLDAVRRVGLLARESSPVKMEFNALGVRLSSSSPDLGGAVEVVEAQYEGTELTAAFNPTYLSDGLTAVTGERVVVEVRDGLKPALVRGEGESYVYLVMPVKLPAPVG